MSNQSKKEKEYEKCGAIQQQESIVKEKLGDPTTPPCPKGYIRDPRTGNCVPDIG